MPSPSLPASGPSSPFPLHFSSRSKLVSSPLPAATLGESSSVAVHVSSSAASKQPVVPRGPVLVRANQNPPSSVSASPSTLERKKLAPGLSFLSTLFKIFDGMAEPKRSADLPPMEAFTFHGLLNGWDGAPENPSNEAWLGVHQNLDRIAEICAKSRFSLSTQYEFHQPTGAPLQTTTFPTPNSPTTRATTPRRGIRPSSSSAPPHRYTNRSRLAAHSILPTIISTSSRSSLSSTSSKKSYPSFHSGKEAFTSSTLFTITLPSFSGTSSKTYRAQPSPPLSSGIWGVRKAEARIGRVIRHYGVGIVSIDGDVGKRELFEWWSSGGEREHDNVCAEELLRGVLETQCSS